MAFRLVQTGHLRSAVRLSLLVSQFMYGETDLATSTATIVTQSASSQQQFQVYCLTQISKRFMHFHCPVNIFASRLAKLQAHTPAHSATRTTFSRFHSRMELKSLTKPLLQMNHIRNLCPLQLPTRTSVQSFSLLHCPYLPSTVSKLSSSYPTDILVCIQPRTFHIQTYTGHKVAGLTHQLTGSRRWAELFLNLVYSRNWALPARAGFHSCL